MEVWKEAMKLVWRKEENVPQKVTETPVLHEGDFSVTE